MCVCSCILVGDHSGRVFPSFTSPAPDMATLHPPPPAAEIDNPARLTSAECMAPPNRDSREEAALSGDGMTAIEAIKSRGVDLQKEWTESPEHPQNWPDRQRWTIALVIALTGFLVRTVPLSLREGSEATKTAS